MGLGRAVMVVAGEMSGWGKTAYEVEVDADADDDDEDGGGDVRTACRGAELGHVVDDEDVRPSGGDRGGRVAIWEKEKRDEMVVSC